MLHLLDLFCGKGGWTVPALALGWRCTGVDITDQGYPGTLIIDALPWDTERIRALAPHLIIASPPCEEYARHHLPWIADKAPDTKLLAWCIGLAASIKIPMLVESSRFGAMHFPGYSRSGSYRLWGSVPALLPQTPRRKTRHTDSDPGKRAFIEPTLSEWIIHHYTELLK